MQPIRCRSIRDPAGRTVLCAFAEGSSNFSRVGLSVIAVGEVLWFAPVPSTRGVQCGQQYATTMLLSTSLNLASIAIVIAMLIRLTN